MKRKNKKQYTLGVRMPNISYSVIPYVPLTTHFLVFYIKYSVYYAGILCNAVLMLDKRIGLHIIYYRNIVRGNTTNNAGGWRCAVGGALMSGESPKGKPPQGVRYIVTTSPTKYIPKMKKREVRR